VAAGAALTLTARGPLALAIAAAAGLGASVLTSEVHVSRTLARSLPPGAVAPAFGILDSALVAAMTCGAALAPALTTALGLRPAMAVMALAVVLLGVASATNRPLPTMTIPRAIHARTQR
jgi:hypothetical protein